MNGKFLFSVLGVCALLFVLVFSFAGSCATTAPPVSGNIVITAMSDVGDPNEEGYFSATGTVRIEDGLVTSYDYQKTGAYPSEGTIYEAESGNVDLTSSKSIASRGMKGVPRGAGSLFSGILAMVVRVSRAYDGEVPVEPPPVDEFSLIVFDAEMQWANGRLSILNEYQNYLQDAKSPRAASPDSVPYRRSEFLYDESGKLERVCSGPWIGDDSVYYYDTVSIYAGYDPKNPRYQTRYSGYDIGTNPETSATPEITSVTCPGGGSLNYPGLGDWFRFYTPGNSYFVWYNLDGLSSDPTYGSPQAIEVATSAEAAADDVAADTVSAIEASGAPVTVSREGAVVIITNDVPGDVDDAYQAYQAPFVITITQGFPNVDLTLFFATYDTQGRIATLSVGDYMAFVAGYDGSGNLESLEYTVEDTDWGATYTGTITFTLPEGLSLGFTDFTPWTSPIGNMIIRTVLPIRDN